MRSRKNSTIKALTKRNVWELQENDVFRIWKSAEKDADLKDNRQHYVDIFKSAFELEEIKIDRPEVTKKYRDRGFKVGELKGLGSEESKWGVKKREIKRVTDLTLDNIHCVSATLLLKLIDKNFGGGWASLKKETQDIIESRFDISTTTLPKDRLHNKGGIYDRKVADHFEILEIPKGTWVEVIFAKEKPTLGEEDKKVVDEEDDDDDFLVDDDEAENFEDMENIIEEDYDDGSSEFEEQYDKELKEEDVIDENAYDERVGYDEEDYGNDRELTIDDVVARENAD